MKLSFVVPVFNEEKRIQKTVREITLFRSNLPSESEWIFVDDGSTDRTEVLAHEALGGMPRRWMKLPTNQGKGRAVQTGILAATGDYIFFTDADLSTPLAEYELLLNSLRQGYDVAVGSRAIRDSRVMVHQNWLRESMGKIFNRIARLLTFRGVRDSQCGFKAFRREAARTLFGLQKTKGFSFDAEILYLAQKLNYRIVEVGVAWTNSKNSKVRIIEDSFLMLADLFRIRWFHRNLKQGGRAG